MKISELLLVVVVVVVVVKVVLAGHSSKQPPRQRHSEASGAGGLSGNSHTCTTTMIIEGAPDGHTASRPSTSPGLWALGGPPATPEARNSSGGGQRVARGHSDVGTPMLAVGWPSGGRQRRRPRPRPRPRPARLGLCPLCAAQVAAINPDRGRPEYKLSTDD